MYIFLNDASSIFILDESDTEEYDRMQDTDNMIGRARRTRAKRFKVRKSRRKGPENMG